MSPTRTAPPPAAAPLIQAQPTRPRRVLYVSPTDEISGADHSLFQLVRCLDRTRFEPHVLLPHAGPFTRAYQELGVAVHHAPVKKLKNTVNPLWHVSYLARAPLRVRRVQRVLEEVQPAVVHINSSVELLAGLATHQAARCPLIWHVREAELRPAAVERAVFGLVGRWADAVVGISSVIGARFASHQHCQVIHNGVDFATLQPKTRRAEAGAPVLGWLGRLAPRKGIENVLALFERLHASCPGARLLVVAAPIAGHDRYARSLRERVAASPAAAQIEWRPGTDAPGAAYAEMDVFAHLPDLAEGLGRTVIEAQAVGTPVLTWPAGGLADAVKDEVSGRLVPVGDVDAAARALIEMLEPSALTALSQGAGQFARARFAAEVTAARVQELYEGMLSR